MARSSDSDNFHSVCSLSFWGKVMKKEGGLKFQRILELLDYLNPFQSGLQLQNFRETAMITLVDDLW